MRNISTLVPAVGLLVLLAISGAAQARDGNDRSQSLDLNRDRSESRIERLREDRSLDKARAEKPAAKKKKPPEPAPGTTTGQ